MAPWRAIQIVEQAGSPDERRCAASRPPARYVCPAGVTRPGSTWPAASQAVVPLDLAQGTAPGRDVLEHRDPSAVARAWWAGAARRHAWRTRGREPRRPSRFPLAPRWLVGGLAISLRLRRRHRGTNNVDAARADQATPVEILAAPGEATRLHQAKVGPGDPAVEVPSRPRLELGRRARTSGAWPQAIAP